MNYDPCNFFGNDDDTSNGNNNNNNNSKNKPFKSGNPNYKYESNKSKSAPKQDEYKSQPHNFFSYFSRMNAQQDDDEYEGDTFRNRNKYAGKGNNNNFKPVKLDDLAEKLKRDAIKKRKVEKNEQIQLCPIIEEVPDTFEEIVNGQEDTKIQEFRSLFEDQPKDNQLVTIDTIEPKSNSVLRKSRIDLLNDCLGCTYADKSSEAPIGPVKDMFEMFESLCKQGIKLDISAIEMEKFYYEKVFSIGNAYNINMPSWTSEKIIEHYRFHGIYPDIIIIDATDKWKNLFDVASNSTFVEKRVEDSNGVSRTYPEALKNNVDAMKVSYQFMISNLSLLSNLKKTATK